MAKEKKLTAAKVRKKIWVELYSPEQFGNAYIGETHVFEAPEVAGKHVTVNLMVLTNDPKRQFAEMKFEVTGVQDGRGITKPKAYLMTASAVKRLMRRRNDKISDSMLFVTADAKIVRIKYFLISKAPTSGSIRADLRNETRDLFAATIRKISFETLLQDVVSYKFQSFVRDSISKLFPIQSCDIKYVGLETAKLGEKSKEQVSESEYYERQSEQRRPRERHTRHEESQENERPETEEQPQVEEKVSEDGQASN